MPEERAQAVTVNRSGVSGMADVVGERLIQICLWRIYLIFWQVVFMKAMNTAQSQALGHLFLPIVIQFKECQWGKMTEPLFFPQVFLITDLRNQSLTWDIKSWINFGVRRESIIEAVDITVIYAFCINICCKSIKNKFTRFKVFAGTFYWVFLKKVNQGIWLSSTHLLKKVMCLSLYWFTNRKDERI